MGRASVNRVVQWGIETTKGTPVAANKALPSTSVDLGPKVESKEYRAQGYKYNTTSRIHKQWGEGPLSGPLDYNQILWPLTSLIMLPTPTTPSGGTASRKWTFLPVSRGADDFKSFTIEQGDGDAAEQMAYSVVTSLTIEITTDDANISGTVIGRKPAATTLTATPTVIPQFPVSAREVDVYMDVSAAALGTTKLTDPFVARLIIGQKFNPKWVLNTANASFEGLIEIPTDLSLIFEIEHGTQSRALFAEIGDNPTKYFRIKCTGPIIEGAIRYSIIIDVAANVTEADQGDVDGDWTRVYTANPIHDTTMGRPFQIEVINVITTLT